MSANFDGNVMRLSENMPNTVLVEFRNVKSISQYANANEQGIVYHLYNNFAKPNTTSVLFKYKEEGFCILTEEELANIKKTDDKIANIVVYDESTMSTEQSPSTGKILNAVLQI